MAGTASDSAPRSVVEISGHEVAATNTPWSARFEHDAEVHDSSVLPEPNNDEKHLLMLELRRAVFNQFIESVTEGTTAAVEKGKESNSILAKKPTEELFATRSHVICISIIAFVYLVISVIFSPLWHPQFGKQTGTHFRFTAIDLQGGQLALHPHISDFGVLQNGCLVHLSNVSTTGASVSMRSSNGAIIFDGWWFATEPDHPPLLDPRRFLLEASSDGANWWVCGGSSWALAGERLVFGTGPLPRSWTAGATVELHHAGRWPWVLLQISPVLGAAGTLCACGLALLRGRGAARTLYVVIFALTATLFAAALGFFLTHRALGPVHAGSSLLFALAFAWIPLALDVLYIPPMYAFLGCGAVVFAGRLLECWRLEMFQLLRLEVPWLVLIIVAYNAVLITVKGVTAFRARALVAADRKEFEACWLELQERENARLHLMMLRNRTQRLQGHILQLDRQRRQLNPKGSDLARLAGADAGADQPIRSELAAEVGDWSCDRTALDASAPVDSLEQLFAQAVTLGPILRCKVVKWARTSDASLAVPSASGDRAVEVLPWQQAEEDARWKGSAGIPWKTRERAREKACCCYRSDVSRLLDICRHRIVFDRVERLLECLNIIARDQEIKLVGVRNAMVKEFDAETTAGYRDLKLNLRIETKLTRRLGIDGHVCELQLVLKEMILAQASHRRYVQLRNLRPAEFHPLQTIRNRIRTMCTGGKMGDGAEPTFSVRESTSASQLPDVDEVLVYGEGAFNPRGSLPNQEQASAPSAGASAGPHVTAAAHGPRASVMEGMLGPGLEPGLAAAFLDYRRVTRLPHRFLQQKVSEVVNAVESAHSDSILFTSKPILAAATRTRWQVLLLIFGLVIGLAAFYVVDFIIGIDDGIAFHRYRFTPIELRGGSNSDIEHPHISGFHLLRHGCPVRDQGLSTRRADPDGGESSLHGASMVLSLEGATLPKINGVKFFTSEDGDPQNDPVRFRLEGMSEVPDEHEDDAGERVAEETDALEDEATVDGEEWKTLTSRNDLHDIRGHVISAERLKFDIPMERGAGVVVDVRVPWQMHLTHVAVNVVASVSFIACAAFGRAGRPRAARRVFVSALFTVAALEVVAGVAWLGQRHYQNGVYWIMFGAGMTVSAVVAGFYEAAFIPGVFASGLALFLWDQIAAVTIYNQTLAEALAAPPFTSIFMMIFTLIAYLYRWRSVAQCRALILRDKQRYDAMWEALVQDSQSAVALQHTAALAETLQVPDLELSRQLNVTSQVKQLLQAQRRWRETEAFESPSRDLSGLMPTGSRSNPSRGSSEPAESLTFQTAVDTSARGPLAMAGAPWIYPLQQTRLAAPPQLQDDTQSVQPPPPQQQQPLQQGVNPPQQILADSSPAVPSVVGELGHCQSQPSPFTVGSSHPTHETASRLQPALPQPLQPPSPPPQQLEAGSNPAPDSVPTPLAAASSAFPSPSSNLPAAAQPSDPPSEGAAHAFGPSLLRNASRGRRPLSHRSAEASSAPESEPRPSRATSTSSRGFRRTWSNATRSSGDSFADIASGESFTMSFGSRSARPRAGERPNWIQRQAALSEKILRRVRRRVYRRSQELGAGCSLLDTSAPVTCLDQLYAQACGLDPILRRKVQEWALVSSGMFPLQTEAESPLGPDVQRFVLWETALQSGEARDAIKWGQVKSPDRAVEKLLRSYKQDVSRLLDMCRQHIAFQSVQDMLVCLRAIAMDSEVVVVRIKNKMHPDYDSHDSAGYRDLSLNVRLETPDARAMGLAGHVCEVQLQLEGFAKVKTRSGHKRYVQYRNFRAE